MTQGRKWASLATTIYFFTSVFGFAQAQVTAPVPIHSSFRIATKPQPLSLAPSKGVLEVPYLVSDAVKAAITTAQAWVELYRVEPFELDTAMDRLVKERRAPEPLAVGIEGKMHVGLGSKRVAFPEVTRTIQRAGAPVVYDAECTVMPEPGDVLTARYRAKDASDELLLSATLVRHYAFGLSSRAAPQLEQLEEVGHENCGAVKESRIFYRGTLTMRHLGKVLDTEPVLVQAVFQ